MTLSRQPLTTAPEMVAAIRAEIERLRVPLPKQMTSLRQLFEMFTTDRGRLRSFGYLDDPKLRGAYLRYHLPLNAARVTYALTQSAAIEPRILQVPRIVDLGAGPGSAAWAAGLQMTAAGTPSAGRVPDIHLYDRSTGALGLSRRLFPANWTVRTNKWMLPALPDIPNGSLVLLSMVLNELLSGDRGERTAELVDALTRSCSAGTFVLIVEPALRGTGRDLMQFRDTALHTGQWRVIAPCTHAKDCPLLAASDRSWCHFRFAWDAPDFVQRIADPMRLEYQNPSVSYLALERVANATPQRGIGKARVIGEPMPIENGPGIYICTDGRRELVSPIPAAWHRGDVVTRP